MGLLVREVFSFWTGHPFDFEIWVRAGYWVARGYTPYASLPPAPGVSFANDFGGPDLSPIIGYLPFWPVLLEAMYGLYFLLGSPTPYLYYFLIKQPIIAGDVLLAYYLYRYLERRGSEKASFVLKLWLFSPYNILLSGVWGMFDAIPMLFVVFALEAEPGARRGFWSGVATFAKSIPIVYAIPLSWGPKPLRNLALAVGIPVFATLAIVLVAGWPIFGQAGITNTVESTAAKYGASLSLWEIIYYLNQLGVISSAVLSNYYWAGYAWIPAVGLATLLAYRWFGFDTERGMVQSLLLITLTFLLVRGEVNEQYALYLYALGLIDVALWSPQRRNALLAAMAAVIAFNGTNDLLFIRYVTPAFHNALAVESGIISHIMPERNALLFVEAAVFFSVNLYYLYSLSRERRSRISVSGESRGVPPRSVNEKPRAAERRSGNR
jgi:Gpi18-like mannosyltransferase